MLVLGLALVGCAVNAPFATQQATPPRTSLIQPSLTVTPVSTVGSTATSIPALPSPTATPYLAINQSKPVWETRPMDNNELVTVSMHACTEEPTLQSKKAVQPTFLRFKNASVQLAKVIWINYEGKRDSRPEQQHIVQHGESLDIWTFVTHPFVVLDLAGHCLAIVLPAEQPGLIIIPGVPVTPQTIIS
ncbi:MAG: hypothetical protein NVS2B4_12070 [Ramlibacter sp.]